MKNAKTQKLYISIKIIIIICAILLSIKYILVDFGLDAAFQTTMAYRIATGDIMFKQMWEPYQMSAFLCAFLVKLYLSIMGSVEGVVLFLQLMGVLIDGVISVFFYRTIKKLTNKDGVAFLAAICLFIISPKDVPLPEYTNMLVWFSTIALIASCEYLVSKKNRYIILLSISLSAMVLSYPSAILVCIALMILFIIKKEYKLVIFVSLICLCLGTIYILFVFSICPPKDLIKVIQGIMSLETSHGEGGIHKLVRYVIEIGKLIGINAIIYGLAYIISFMISKIFKYKKRSELADVIYILGIICLSMYMAINWQRYVRFNFHIFFIAIIVVGIKNFKRIDSNEKNIYVFGLVIASFDFISGLVLTNLRLTDTLPLLLLGMVISFIPLYYVLSELSVQRKQVVVGIISLVFIGMLMFRNAYIIRPLSGDISSIMHVMRPLNGDISNIFHVSGRVKAGPAKGIISEYMGPHIQNETYSEWQEYIQDGDAVFLIGWGIDSSCYMYKNVIISAPSTVPTPDYNESLLEYWEMNPERYPDVIIASCWSGKMNSRLTEDSFIMKWIEEEYKPSKIIDGEFWRYYFK